MELTPGQTPPLNRENVVFDLWLNASVEDRLPIERKLMSLLRVHASKLCWMVLHKQETHIIDEIVEDTLMDLATFRGDCAFSTWFHSRAVNRLRVEFRRPLWKKEIPLDGAAVDTLPAPQLGAHDRALAHQILSQMSEKDRKFVTLKLFQGMTDSEVASELGWARQSVTRKWSKLRKRLKEKYNGAI